MLHFAMPTSLVPTHLVTLQISTHSYLSGLLDPETLIL